MKILFCNFEYPPLGGGGGVVNASLAQELAKRHEVSVLTSQAPGLPSERIEEGVRVVRVPVFFRNEQTVASYLSMLTYLPVGFRVGKKLLMNERFDVINTHFVLPTGPVGDALTRFAKIPNVLSVHGGDLYDPSKFASPHRHALLRIWIRRLLRRADRVVGQSWNTLENMRRYYTPELEGTRIPLGIPRPKMEAASRGEYGFGNDEALLVTVGRLVGRKAVDQLISMMETMRNEPVRLLIIGTGPLEAQLKDQASEKRLGEKVIFMGQVDEHEKFRILQMCDLYVSTSQHEGFGLVFLEAMASGLPIVCYDHGGQTDFLKDGVNGFLIPLNDQDRFLDRCRLLIRDRERRVDMTRTNQKTVEDYYIDRCAVRYEQVFTEVCQKRTGTRQAGN
jgi:glycosyltransferase involved in cell wall biosynthesis